MHTSPPRPPRLPEREPKRQPTLPERGPLFSRRNLLIGAGALAFLAWVTPDDEPATAPSNERSEPTDPRSFAERNPFDGSASESADKLGVTVGGYYKLDENLVQTISTSGHFRTEPTMAPVFFPEVMEHQKELEASAAEFDVPVNVLASLACMESAGLDDAHSAADAYGILQVVPGYHFDKFAHHLPAGASLDDYELAKEGESSTYSLSTYTDVFTDPRINMRASAAYFADCIAAAREHYTDINPDSMIIYAFAASAYNGGIGSMQQGFDGMPLESQLYINHMARITIDVEMALSMRQDGYSDSEILTALKSDQMDALAYAYSEMPRAGSSIDEYEQQATLISQLDDMNNAPDSIKEPYETYMNGNTDHYTTPMAPGLRIWFAGGGRNLFILSDENLNWKA